MVLSSCTTVRPVAATSNPVGNKCGEASASRFLGLFGGSDNMGINKAAKSGGITKISHIDYKIFQFYPFYTKYTVLVYGE